MKMTCDGCGYTSDFAEFQYIGAPGSGWGTRCNELRECPRCGTQTVFSRPDALELEDMEMKDLSKELMAIPKDADKTLMKKAKEIILRLRRVNQRWNIPELDEFLNQKQKELRIGYWKKAILVLPEVSWNVFPKQYLTFLI